MKKKNIALVLSSGGARGFAHRSISLMLHKISLLTLEKHQPDLLINISRHSFGTYDFYKAKDIIEEGERAAKKAIERQLK
jgi:NTE family protein